MSKCSVLDCSKEAERLGMCVMHYTRQRRYGNTQTTLRNKIGDRPEIKPIKDRNLASLKKEQQLTYKDLIQQLLYEPETGYFFWRNSGKRAGSLQQNGYEVIRVNGNLYLSHRLAWLATYEQWPTTNLDHYNQDRSDNRIINLRETNDTVQMHNTGLQSNNTSGYKGVAYDNRYYYWIAYITVNKQRIHLGSFATKEQAIEARQNAEIYYARLITSY